MALKPERVIIQTIVDQVCNTAAERGKLLCFDASNPGEVKIETSASGKYPAGIVLNDVVDLDLTARPANLNKDQVDIDSLVALVNRGEVMTNALHPSCDPNPGEPAYMAQSGLLHDAGITDWAIRVGTFLGEKDADGYVKVNIDL